MQAMFLEAESLAELRYER